MDRKEKVKTWFRTVIRDYVKKANRQLSKPITKEQMAALHDYLDSFFAEKYDIKETDTKAAVMRKMKDILKKWLAILRRNGELKKKATMRPLSVLQREVEKKGRGSMLQVVLDEFCRVLRKNGEEDVADYVIRKQPQKNYEDIEDMSIAMRRMKDVMKKNVRIFRQKQRQGQEVFEDEREEADGEDLDDDELQAEDEVTKKMSSTSSLRRSRRQRRQPANYFQDSDDEDQDLQEPSDEVNIHSTVDFCEVPVKRLRVGQDNPMAVPQLQQLYVEIPNSGSTTTTTSSSSSATQSASCASLPQTLQNLTPPDEDDTMDSEDRHPSLENMQLRLEETTNQRDVSSKRDAACDKNQVPSVSWLQGRMEDAIQWRMSNPDKFARRVKRPLEMVNEEPDIRCEAPEPTEDVDSPLMNTDSHSPLLKKEDGEGQAPKSPVSAKGAQKEVVGANKSGETAAAGEDEINGQEENGSDKQNLMASHNEDEVTDGEEEDALPSLVNMVANQQDASSERDCSSVQNRSDVCSNEPGENVAVEKVEVHGQEQKGDGSDKEDGEGQAPKSPVSAKGAQKEVVGANKSGETAAAGEDEINGQEENGSDKQNLTASHNEDEVTNGEERDALPSLMNKVANQQDASSERDCSSVQNQSDVCSNEPGENVAVEKVEVHGKEQKGDDSDKLSNETQGSPVTQSPLRNVLDFFGDRFLKSFLHNNVENETTNEKMSAETKDMFIKSALEATCAKGHPMKRQKNVPLEAYTTVPGEPPIIEKEDFVYSSENTVRSQESPQIGMISCECKGVCDVNCRCWKTSYYYGSSFIAGDQIVRLSDEFNKSWLVVCGAHCGCSADCGNRLPKDVTSKNLELIRRHETIGVGVRTNVPFLPGDIVFEFAGEVINTNNPAEVEKLVDVFWSWTIWDSRLPKEQKPDQIETDQEKRDRKKREESNRDKLFEMIAYSLGYKKKKSGANKKNTPTGGANQKDTPADIKKKLGYLSAIQVTDRGNIGRLVSTSRYPNVLPIRVIQNEFRVEKMRLIFSACRPILPDQELFADYGPGYKLGQCLCGLAACDHSEHLNAIGKQEALKFMKEMHSLQTRRVEELQRTSAAQKREMTAEQEKALLSKLKMAQGSIPRFKISF